MDFEVDRIFATVAHGHFMRESMRFRISQEQPARASAGNAMKC